MSGKKYCVLQSGFVAPTEKGLVLPEPIEPTLRQAVVFKEFKSPLRQYFYSPKISHLFHVFLVDEKVIRQFDFREKLLKAFFEAFGGMNVRDWLILQSESSVIGDMHRVFLVETLEYVYGRELPRRTAPSQWITLLEADRAADLFTMDFDSYFQRSHQLNQSHIKVPSDIVDMAQAWTSKPDGFVDMLFSMFIIFGQRTDRVGAGFA